MPNIYSHFYAPIQHVIPYINYPLIDKPFINIKEIYRREREGGTNKSNNSLVIK